MDNNSKEMMLNVLGEERAKKVVTIIDSMYAHTINIANGKYNQDKLNELISDYLMYLVMLTIPIPRNQFETDLNEMIGRCITRFIQFCEDYQKEKGWTQEV